LSFKCKESFFNMEYKGRPESKNFPFCFLPFSSKIFLFKMEIPSYFLKHIFS
jgi:hypothetical protein